MQILKKAAQPIWTGVRYWVYRSVSYVSGRVPVRFAYWVGTLAGDFVYLTWRRHSANAVSNMRRVLGEGADWQVVKEMARDSFRNYAKTLVDFLRYPHLDREDVDRAVPRQTGWQHLTGALERGKGLIVVTGHIGNWDMAGAVMGHKGLPLHAVADKFEPQKMDDLINGTREKHGLNIISMEPGSLKQIFSALRKNEIVLLLFDRPQPEDGVAVTFFGETAYLPAGPAAIAIRTGAALAIGYCLRQRGDKRFAGVFEKPIEYQHLLTGNKEADIQRVTQEIVTHFEAIIREHPDQWYMFREMWPRTEHHDDEIKKRRFYGNLSLRRASHALRDRLSKSAA